MTSFRLTGDLVGGWCQLPSSAVADIIGTAGYDFVVIDTQHGLIGDDTLLPMVQALAAPTLVRVPGHGPEPISRALDRGADGVIVPLVDTAEQAADAVAACHYPPRGRRSYGPTRNAWHGRDVLAPGLCVVMVETAAALLGLPEIVAVDGLDAVFVGPSDLALNTGHGLEALRGDPSYDAVLADVASTCRAAGVPVGIWCTTPADAARRRELGFTFTTVGSDQSLLRAAAVDAASRR